MRTNNIVSNNSTQHSISGTITNANRILQRLLWLGLVVPLCLSGVEFPILFVVQSFTSVVVVSPPSTKLVPSRKHQPTSHTSIIGTTSCSSSCSINPKRIGCVSSQRLQPTVVRRRRASIGPLFFKDEENVESSSSKKKDSAARRVQTKEKVDAEKLVRQKHDLKEEEPILWRVLLHNDHVHTFSYVVQSIVKVVGILTRAQAWEVVVQAHANDRATICKVWKSKAEQFCLGLQRQGLTASIVPDYEFNYNDYLRHQLGAAGSTTAGKLKQPTQKSKVRE